MAQKFITLSQAAQNAEAGAIGTLLNAGSVRVYAGQRPTNPSQAVTTMNPAPLLLATFTLPNPAFATAANGVAMANAITGVMPVAEGHADWWRGLDSGGVAVVDGNCASDGSASLALSVEVPMPGTTLTVTSLRLPGPSQSQD